MTLGWAYILSVRLVEMQGESIAYTNSSASVVYDGADAHAKANSLFIDVGDADPAAVRWWSAVPANGQGWHAVICEPAYLSPWSVSYQGSLGFKIKASTIASIGYGGLQQPPSSHQALEYLADFCALHSLVNQSSAALAAALTLPLHNLTRSEARLPAPMFAKCRVSPSKRPDFAEERHDLPYYMILSCTARLLDSAIWGTFWEPGVDCNLIGSLFRPISDCLVPVIEHSNHEMFARIMTLHRPKLAPLWLGSILTGLTPSRVISFLKRLEGAVSRPDPDVSAWTASPQSFMDVQGSGPYLQKGNTIRRADVWRLRYDCQANGAQQSPYANPPLSGWPPFGHMPLKSIELDVWEHRNCHRHERRYAHWTWKMEDGSTFKDDGFQVFNVGCNLPANFECLASEPEYTGTESNEQVSKASTVLAFAWVTGSGEGYDPAEEVYSHPWLREHLRHDEDSDMESDVSSTATLSDRHEMPNDSFFTDRFMTEQIKSE